MRRRRRPGGIVKKPNRKPPTGGKYCVASGWLPSSGKCGVASPPHSRWNSLPGSRFGTIGATDESLTNTAFPSASCPVTTRRTSMEPP